MNITAMTSVGAVRDAVQSIGTVVRVDVIVAGVLVDGVESPQPFVRQPADRVSYRVIPIDESVLRSLDPSLLNGIKPHNRPVRAGRIFSASTTDMMELFVIPASVSGALALQLYHKGTERPDYYRCDGTPLEP